MIYFILSTCRQSHYLFTVSFQPWDFLNSSGALLTVGGNFLSPILSAKFPNDRDFLNPFRLPFTHLFLLANFCPLILFVFVYKRIKGYKLACLAKQDHHSIQRNRSVQFTSQSNKNPEPTESHNGERNIFHEDLAGCPNGSRPRGLLLGHLQLFPRPRILRRGLHGRGQQREFIDHRRIKLRD